MERLTQYDLVMPGKIAFGWGRRKEIGGYAKALGRRAFIVVGMSEANAAPWLGEMIDCLRAEGVEADHVTSIRHEPEVSDVDNLASALRSRGAGEGDLLIGFGGGAAMDLAKAAAAMATNTQSDTVRDYLENVGRDLKIVNDPLPIIAVPTTAGTGAEATKNAVISSYSPHFKKSLRDDRIMARVALVDPEYTIRVSAETTAASGMDAITQLIESYVSVRAKPIPQALALDGIRGVFIALEEAVKRPDSKSARTAMSHAALLSGVSLANAGLGFAHGVAAALGVHCRIPHGMACAMMLPTALAINRDVRLNEFARLSEAAFERMFASAGEAVDYLVERVSALCDRLKIGRRLRDVGVAKELIPDLAKDSRGNSMSGNPKQLNDAELIAVLENAW